MAGDRAGGRGAMTTVAEETDVYRASFERFADAAARREPAWLVALRRQAMARFAERGFPTTREEAWKYTSVAPIVRTTFRPAEDGAQGVAADTLRHLAFGTAGGSALVFVNGRHVPALSTAPPAGVEVRSLRDILAREPERVKARLSGQDHEDATVFAALNSAFFEDGAFVEVASGAVITDPIHLVFFSTQGDGAPTVSHPRNLVRAGRGSQVTIVESYGGGPGAVYFTNAVTEVVLEDGAAIDHYKLQRESTAAFHVAALNVQLGRASRFSDHSISLGAALGRNDIEVRFAAESGECVLNGLFLAGGHQHMDTHTLIDHAKPHGSSRELYKGVLDGRARGVFNGKIVVRKDAQKTDAYQSNKNLLLSREALVNSTPALEILADDVKCKHGSTTGQLDPAALFYLRSRGLSEGAARSLLVYAFASDLVRQIKVEWLRSGLEAEIESRLPGVPVPQEAAS